MNTNEFSKLTQLVDTTLNKYRTIRKVCRIADDDWHSRSIERMAKPFIKGYFTLAIVGKVSSGKSTFINALLGCKNLLPTGHDQTTCGVTYIEYGETPEVTITFGDGNKTTIKDNISEKVKSYVAIPEKYHNLPVNNIDDMILGGYDYEKIWERHEQLEKETLCAKIDKTLLKNYVENRKKKDIATEVRMRYPFNKELKGWRVIDTPGIGAIGGIETRTKQLLATQTEDGSREVDAIIFLQKGSETLDQTDSKKFVNEQLDNLSESDKRRLFYVLTHSSSTDFLNHKTSKLDFIKQNYGDKIKCLTYADSLLYTFISYIEGNEVDLKGYDDFVKPEGWANDEWDAIMTILDHAKRHLKNKNDAFNNDTMLRTIQSWANFESLKSEINQFAKKEKQKCLREFINLIKKDYSGFIKRLNKEKELIDGGLSKINKERDIVEARRSKFNALAKEADKKFNIDKISSKFKFIDKELDNFQTLESINNVRTAITNLFDNVQEAEREFFEEFSKTFSDFLKEDDLNDIILESLDFGNILQEATSASQEVYEISPEQVIYHTSKPDERIPAKYGTRTNEAEKLRNFMALTLQRVRKSRDKFLPQVKQKVYQMRQLVFDELNKKLKEEEYRLEELKTELSNKEKFKDEKDKIITESHDAIMELNKLVNEYGI